MQPLGRKPKLYPYRNVNPIHGRVNWWEVELDSGGNKKASRQEVNKLVRKEIIDMEGDEDDE